MAILRKIVPVAAGEGLQSEVASLHTQNGDSIEVSFSQVKAKDGTLSFGFQGGFEHALVSIDFGKKEIRLNTSSDWTRSQPGMVSRVATSKTKQHTLILRKTAGHGCLVRKSNIDVVFDGTVIASEKDLNLLPEMGVSLKHEKITVNRLIQKGISRKTPKHLRIAGWQMLNSDSIETNLESI